MKNYKFAVLDRGNHLLESKFCIEQDVWFQYKKFKVEAVKWEENMHQFVYWLNPSVGRDVPEDEIFNSKDDYLDELISTLACSTFHHSDETAKPIVDEFIKHYPELLEKYSIDFLYKI